MKLRIAYVFSLVLALSGTCPACPADHQGRVHHAAKEAPGTLRGKKVVLLPTECNLPILHSGSELQRRAISINDGTASYSSTMINFGPNFIGPNIRVSGESMQGILAGKPGRASDLRHVHFWHCDFLPGALSELPLQNITYLTIVNSSLPSNWKSELRTATHLNSIEISTCWERGSDEKVSLKSDSPNEIVHILNRTQHEAAVRAKPKFDINSPPPNLIQCE